MPLSTDVRLPKSVQPVFPQRCVYSGEADPDAEVVVVASTQNVLVSFLAPLLLLFGWPRIRAPILRRYRARFYFLSYGRDVLTVVLVILAVFIFIRMVDLNSAYVKLQLFGLVVAALCPWVLFDVFFPRRFGATARGEWIVYEFASAEYAREFAALNDSRAI